MHSSKTPTRPLYRLSNTVQCSSRLSTLSLAELVADDDDCMPTLPAVTSGGRGGAEPPPECASLPELRPTTTSSSRCQNKSHLNGLGISHDDGTTRSLCASVSSPILPGESGGTPHRRPVASTTNERGVPARAATATIVPQPPPSRLERTLREIASVQEDARGGSMRLSRTPAGRTSRCNSHQLLPTNSRSHQVSDAAEADEAFLEEVRAQAAACAPTIPRFLPMSTKQALQALQQAIRALVTARGADLGSVPTLLITTYNIVCKQAFNDTATVVRTDASETANQPRSLFDTLAYGGEDTTIATELRDLQRELLLTKKHYHVAIQQIDIFKHRLNEHVAEIRRLEKVVDQATAVELDLRANITGLKQTIQSKNMECSELKSNIVALHSSMHDVQRNDHVRISERTADLRHELVALYEQVRQGEEMTKSYEREVENLQGDVRRTEERYEDSQRELVDTQSALAVRDDELYQLKLSTIELNDKIKHLEVHIEDLLVVQGDTMIQDKMIRENPEWHVYKESITNDERPRKLDNVIIPSHIKFIRGFGVDERIPGWLRAEGKVKAKFLNKGDTVHIALQALTDLSLPASLASNMRALLKPPQGPQGTAVAGPLTGLGAGGQRGSISFNREGSRGRDDLIFNSIGTASGPSSSGTGQRRSLQSGNGDVSLNELTSRLPFSDGFKCWLSRNGTDLLNNKQGTELAYGFHYSLQRWRGDPDLVLFDAILRGDVPPELHYHVYRCFDDLLQHFVTADEDMHKGDARKALPVTTVARVLKKAVHAMPSAYATDDDAEHLLFLMTLDFNIPYIPYRALFEYNEDGERNHFLQEYCSLVVDRTLEYYDVLQTIIESLGQAALLEAAADVQYTMPAALTGTTPDRKADGGVEERRMSDPQIDSDLSSHGGARDDDDDDDEPEEKTDYPGHGHPTRPIPPSLKEVQVSLQRFGELWAVEDPAKSDDIVDLISLIRMTILSAEQAKKKAEEEAAAAAANPIRGRARFVAPPVPVAGGRRGTTGKANLKEEAAPSVDPNEPPRDLFTVQAMVTALRQLVVTRSSHRLLMQQSPLDRSDPSRHPLSDSSAAAVSPTPSSVQPLCLESAVDEPPLQLDATVPANHTTPGEPVGDGHQELPHVVAVRPSVAVTAHTPSNVELPPPDPIKPRFNLEEAVQSFLNPNGSLPKGTPGRKSIRSLSTLLPSGGSPSFGGSFKDLGSVASQSLAGGGFGVPQSRAALQALAKRNQTVLPPFFKMRMMRH